MLPGGVVLLVLMLFNVALLLLQFFFLEGVQDQFVAVLKYCLCYVPSNQ